MSDKEFEELKARIDRIELICQELGNRVDNLEKGEYGTGVYLDGCTQADAEYIVGKPIEKAGE